MEIDNCCPSLANQPLPDPDSSCPDTLSISFDPFIFKHIKELKLDGVNINNFIIVFWDISKFSGLVKELKALLIKRMKKQGAIFHELEYLLRDYFNEATRVIE